MFQFSLVFTAKGVFYFNNRFWNEGRTHAVNLLERSGGGERERESESEVSGLGCKFPNSSALILPVWKPTLKTLMIEKG